MFFDMNTPRGSTTLLAFNGELIGCVIEADTSAGYVVQARQKWKPEDPSHAVKFEKVRLEGRVDVIGDTELDSARVRFERLNKVRAELNLPLIPEPPFLDEK